MSKDNSKLRESSKLIEGKIESLEHRITRLEDDLAKKETQSCNDGEHSHHDFPLQAKVQHIDDPCESLISDLPSTIKLNSVEI